MCLITFNIYFIFTALAQFHKAINALVFFYNFYDSFLTCTFEFFIRHHIIYVFFVHFAPNASFVLYGKGKNDKKNEIYKNTVRFTEQD